MKFDYRVLNNITNQDFQTCGAQLLRYCKEIERKYNAGELRDCCRDARVANEVLLRYLYKRLLSSGGEPTAGMILQSPKFAQKIGDIELIVAAEKVQKTGNQYSHAKAYDNETREQYENRMKLEDAKLIFIVDDLLEKLTTVLEHAVTIINSIPSARNNRSKSGAAAHIQNAASNHASNASNAPGKAESAPKGRLYLEKVENYNGTGVKLAASLADADFKLEDPDVSIEWGFISSTGNYIPVTGDNSRKVTDFKCSLGKGALDKRYKCTVRRQGFSKPLEAVFRPLTKEDFEQTAEAPPRKKSKGKALWPVLFGCLAIAAAAGIFFLRHPEDTASSLPGWGPERPTYTNEEPADHAVFNSITDNPAVRDERDFVRIEEKSSGRPYSSDITIEAGKQYEVYIYYHNNASSSYNDEEHDYAGVARDVRLAASFPGELSAGDTGIVSAAISAGNTEPEAVWDGAYITAEEDVTLSYVEGTAKIYNDWDVNGSVLSESLFSEEGTFLGLNELNGVILGCDEYSGSIVYTIQVSAAD